MISNADFGLTLQKRICDSFNLEINHWADTQFSSAFNPDYLVTVDDIIPTLFEKIGAHPIQLLTYSDEMLGKRANTSPHNFMLNNGKTMSIRTTRSGDKVCPKVIGQPGKDTFNEFFADLYGKPIESEYDIKKVVFENIHEMLPTFIDYFFQSDVTAIITKMDKENLQVFNIEEVGEYSFSRSDLTFTRGLDNWNESTTLKLDGVSIAEIQVHKDPSRFFKFRFIVHNIPVWFERIKINNETLGMSAEAAICDLFDLEKPDSFKTRASKYLERQLTPAITKAFEELPRPIQHSGSTPGHRGEQSKCSYDFVLEGNKTLSLKTNKGKMACPPEVGQPGSKTCLLYFERFFEPGTSEVTNVSFKEMVYGNIENIMPIYVEHMFDSDWLLWIYESKGDYEYKSINRMDSGSFNWERDKFSFTKPTLEDWNESNTVKYDGLSIGEFQVHSNRSCFKFRFNLMNLLKLMGNNMD